MRTLAAVLAAPLLFVPSGFRVETVASLEFPTSIAFAPDGRIFVNERAGRIRIVKDGTLLDSPFATVRASTSGENGSFGIALHPRFAEGEPFVYVFFTEADGRSNTVVRFRADGDTGTDRRTILGGLPAGTYHNGGMVEFGPDGMLYVSHGEGHSAGRAQNAGTLGGKIYRLTPDGDIPGDNPFRDTRAYAIGLRNPFGMAWDPVSDVLFASDNGPSGGDGPSCCDKLRRVERGSNQAWPMHYRCSDRASSFVRCYDRTIVPTGVAFGARTFPEPYRDSVYMGQYGQGGMIRRYALSGDRKSVDSEETFHSGEEVVGLEAGPDGLYFTTPDALKRIVSTTTAAASPATTAQPRETSNRSPWPFIAGGIAILVVAALVFRPRRR